VNNIDLINRKEVLEFLEEDYGFWEYIRMIAPRVGIDETEAIELADEVRFAIRDTIESMPVFEERENATLQICEHHEDWGDYPRPYYLYHCSSCFESVRQDYPNEDFKFCPHCGAQYVVKFTKEK
jgi:DNA-directed RNA polymerase subunit RPC12/RpoP